MTSVFSASAGGRRRLRFRAPLPRGMTTMKKPRAYCSWRCALQTCVHLRAATSATECAAWVCRPPRTETALLTLLLLRHPDGSHDRGRRSHRARTCCRWRRAGGFTWQASCPELGAVRQGAAPGRGPACQIAPDEKRRQGYCLEGPPGRRRCGHRYDEGGTTLSGRASVSLPAGFLPQAQGGLSLLRARLGSAGGPGPRAFQAQARPLRAVEARRGGCQARGRGWGRRLRDGLLRF